jgi:hypothetical protein
MPLDETPEWNLGELAVAAVIQEALAHDVAVLRLDLIENGGPPAFLTKNGDITTPDLLVGSKGHQAFIEVKWKTAPVLHQKTRTWRHGVDEWNWRNYLQAQTQTGIPGFLYLVECKRGTYEPDNPYLLACSFERLSAKAIPHDGGGDPEVWWDRDVFNRRPLEWDTDGRIEIPRNPRPWERPGRDGSAPHADD